jgi:hypothetical protein
VIDLSKPQWSRLYKEVSLFAQRRTYTKVPKRQWNARDRAQEAVQRACERMITQKPAWVSSYDDARLYLFAAVRSELDHVKMRAETRKEAEAMAATEDAALWGDAAPSPEVVQLQKAIALRDQSKAARILELTKEELGDDRIALGTITCMADEKMSPAEQARILECDVEEVYLARTRRVRAVTRALARYAQESKPEDEEQA